jgi:hypothetical protein
MRDRGKYPDVALLIRITLARNWHWADVGFAPNVLFAPIVLKKSFFGRWLKILRTAGASPSLRYEGTTSIAAKTIAGPRIDSAENCSG